MFHFYTNYIKKNNNIILDINKTEQKINNEKINIIMDENRRFL